MGFTVISPGKQSVLIQNHLDQVETFLRGYLRSYEVRLVNTSWALFPSVTKVALHSVARRDVSK
jgi:hypothetical protein